MRRSQDLGVPSTVVTNGPWTARDAFIAETSVTLDRLTAKIERLERQEAALVKRVAELTEHAQQATRLQALAESLRNSRDYKLDEVFRLVRDLRTRVDCIEGPRTEFNALTYKTLSAIDGKLAELSAARGKRGIGHLPSAGLVAGLVMVTAAVSLAGLIS